MKLTQEQLKKIAPPASSHGQDVVIVGWKEYGRNFRELNDDGYNYQGLPVRSN